MERVIDSFVYLVLAPNREGYYTQHVANVPYILKPGDLIYLCWYKGRGDWHRGEIIDINSITITLQDRLLKNRQTLPFNIEPPTPLYKAEVRKLIFCPFPPFAKKINFSRINQGEMQFAEHHWSGINDCCGLQKYMQNLCNINPGRQISLF
ncbi:MAG: hypothetical protein ACOY9Y_10885 [Bacillota bacterium]